MNQFEIGILDLIRSSISCKVLDVFFKYFTNLGSAVCMIFLVVLLLVFRKTRKIGVTAGIALVIGLIVANLILKNIFCRVRPYEIVNVIDLLIVKTNDYSFPSAHTMAIFEVAISVMFYNKRFGVFACVIATLVAFSRLYLFAHYPTDVLAGIVLAIGSAFLARFIARKLISKYPKLF